MEAHGRCKLPRRVQILPESKERMKEHIFRWIKEGKKVRFYFSGEGIPGRGFLGTQKKVDGSSSIQSRQISVSKPGTREGP